LEVNQETIVSILFLYGEYEYDRTGSIS